jgi:hypothetical protein
MVQVKPNLIAKRKKRLHVLQFTSKLALIDQGNEEHDKQPHDTIVTK